MIQPGLPGGAIGATYDSSVVTGHGAGAVTMPGVNQLLQQAMAPLLTYEEGVVQRSKDSQTLQQIATNTAQTATSAAQIASNTEQQDNMAWIQELARVVKAAAAKQPGLSSNFDSMLDTSGLDSVALLADFSS